ncbi:hypothetical protein R3P38DRAFT_1114295 [Favolaschia claudopus]|uniref:Uncharacterized protein n=1 Tax=Favolaschia claudopus TaxID=2862362 RepID=A0AAW0B7U9_9AGAR
MQTTISHLALFSSPLRRYRHLHSPSWLRLLYHSLQPRAPDCFVNPIFFHLFLPFLHLVMVLLTDSMYSTQILLFRVAVSRHTAPWVYILRRSSTLEVFCHCQHTTIFVRVSFNRTLFQRLSVVYTLSSLIASAVIIVCLSSTSNALLPVQLAILARNLVSPFTNACGGSLFPTPAPIFHRRWAPLNRRHGCGGLGSRRVGNLSVGRVVVPESAP